VTCWCGSAGRYDCLGFPVAFNSLKNYRIKCQNINSNCLLFIRRFRGENRERLEQNQRAQFASAAASQWLAMRLQLIGVVMVTGVATVAIVEHTYSTVDAGT